MRRTCLWTLAALTAAPLTAQTNHLSGPPLIRRHAHVRDGVLIGASVGGFAGGFIGLATDRVLCPSTALVCKTPEGKLLSLVAGLAIGGAVGGVTGGVIGAFIHTTDRPGVTAAGVSVTF